ncbi:hypothetical protein PM082_024902 [Marasmius tenuissimus]|nr:hypothetical protein PM082_024902 [Marasmius tenuissimus]
MSNNSNQNGAPSHNIFAPNPAMGGTRNDSPFITPSRPFSHDMSRMHPSSGTQPGAGYTRIERPHGQMGPGFQSSVRSHSDGFGYDHSTAHSSPMNHASSMVSNMSPGQTPSSLGFTSTSPEESFQLSRSSSPMAPIGTSVLRPTEPDIPSISPVALANDTANLLKLDQEHRQKLMVYVSLCKDLPEAHLTSSIIIHAHQLQILSEVKAIRTEQAEYREVIKKVEQKLVNSNELAKPQNDEIKSQAKVVVFEPSRVDFDNEAISKSIKERLGKHRKTNGFDDYLKSEATANMKKTLKHALNREASYAKTALREIINSSLNDPKHRASVTATVLSAGRKLLGSTEKIAAPHAIRVILLRQFGRENPHYFKKRGQGQAPGAGSKRRHEEMEADINDMDDDLDVEEKPSGEEESSYIMAFGSWLRKKQEDEEWGTDYSKNKWTEYLRGLVEAEKKDWPDDHIALIPLVAAQSPPPTLLQPGSSFQLSHQLSQGNDPFQAGFNPEQSQNSAAGSSISNQTPYSRMFLQGNLNGSQN